MTTIGKAILVNVRERETLHAALLQLNERAEVKVGVLRSALLRDETAALMLRAEETVPADALSRWQSRVNRGCPTRWQASRQRPRLFKELTGKQVWEI